MAPVTPEAHIHTAPSPRPAAGSSYIWWPLGLSSEHCHLRRGLRLQSSLPSSGSQGVPSRRAPLVAATLRFCFSTLGWILGANLSRKGPQSQHHCQTPDIRNLPILQEMLEPLPFASHGQSTIPWQAGNQRALCRQAYYCLPYMGARRRESPSSSPSDPHNQGHSRGTSRGKAWVTTQVSASQL